MATRTWTNAAGGSWATGSNWSGGLVPTAADEVDVGVPDLAPVDVGVAAVHGALHVGWQRRWGTVPQEGRQATADADGAGGEGRQRARQAFQCASTVERHRCER